MDDTRLEFRKYDGTLHWFQSTRQLGTDEYGIWLGALAGATWQRGDGRVYTNEHAQVLLCSPDRWWTATFNDWPAETSVYVDVSMPAAVLDGLVRLVDLDLDVRCLRDGSVRLEDVEEFAEHRVKYRYPAEVVVAAESAASWLVDNVTKVEPFVSVYGRYMNDITGRV